jgi:hypothetical protein
MFSPKGFHMSSIEGKDRCDVLLNLANFRMTRVISRREHEWKVTVALWALLAAGIAKPPLASLQPTPSFTFK